MPVDAVTDGATAAQDATATDAAQGTQQQEFALDTWLATQPEHVRAALEDNVAGLKSALKSERDGRTTLEKQIKALGQQAAAGSELKTELEKLSGELTDTNAKADFFKDAHEARVTDLELAWLAAKSGGFIDKRTGAVDLQGLRTAHPALFAPAKPTVPAANQGNGTGQEGAKKTSMNDFMRAGAGRSIR